MEIREKAENPPKDCTDFIIRLERSGMVLKSYFSANFDQCVAVDYFISDKADAEI